MKNLLLSCIGVASCVLLPILGFAADDNIEIYDTITNNTKNRGVLFFNKYTENNLNEEMFSGSSTTSGGTSTFSAGVVNVEDLFNDKEFSILMTPTTI